MVVAPAASATNNHQSAADIKPQHEISPPNAPITKNKSNNNNDDPAKHKSGCHPAKRGVSIIVVYEILMLLIIVCKLVDSILTDELSLIIRYGAVGILAFLDIIFLIIALITEKQQFFIPYFFFRILTILCVFAFAIYNIYDISTTSDDEIQNIHKYYNISSYKPVNILKTIFAIFPETLLVIFFMLRVYECYGYFRDLKTPQQLPDPIAIKNEQK